jgi:hypothetical protein
MVYNVWEEAVSIFYQPRIPQLCSFAPPLMEDEYDEADRRDIPVVDVRNKPNAICEPS